mmetsp:Transcript_11531/g.20465  ORF Transcript_11531/g.20465 Transcript_11531/m.20465 type:complete len:255 (-) Transcript_11531:647-1411(-)
MPAFYSPKPHATMPMSLTLHTCGSRYSKVGIACTYDSDWDCFARATASNLLALTSKPVTTRNGRSTSPCSTTLSRDAGGDTKCLARTRWGTACAALEGPPPLPSASMGNTETGEVPRDEALASLSVSLPTWDARPKSRCSSDAAGEGLLLPSSDAAGCSMGTSIHCWGRNLDRLARTLRQGGRARPRAAVSIASWALSSATVRCMARWLPTKRRGTRARLALYTADAPDSRKWSGREGSTSNSSPSPVVTTINV